MRFYADENFPFYTVAELRNLGHDVLTAFEDGKANQKISDEEVLQRASELGRAVLTINRKDFRKLHETDSSHAGIFICTFDADFTGQARRIAEKTDEIKSAKGQLIRVYRSS
ncbi:MAG: DUF5615 family PIN-like protein [Pyrinomonadaceae bacterium]